MKKTFFLIALIFGFLVFAQQKEEKLVEVTAKSVNLKKGKNANIKMDAPSKDKAVAKPDQSRGTCVVTIDNYTGFYVKVYVDGYYKGTVAPWDDDSVTVAGGYTRVYCITTGGSYDWTANGGCDDYYFRFRISTANAN